MKKMILTMLVTGAALMAQTANTPAPAQNSTKPKPAQSTTRHRHAKKSGTAAATKNSAATKNAAQPSTPSK